MANVTLRNSANLLTKIPKQYASTATQAKASNEKKRVVLAKEPIRVSKLENGIVVASLENHSPLTRVAAIVNAGARDETHDQLGAAHALRTYASLATRNYSVFGVSRNLNQIGADFSVTSTREQTKYLLEVIRPNLARGVEILGEIISRPELRHWEIDDARPRLNFELDVFDESPELKVVELLHRAAFRNGLSRSLYAPRYNVDNLDSDALNEFRKNNFTSDRLSLVGVGIKHDDLVRLADQFRLPVAKSKATREPAKYLGSEIREDNLSALIHVALGSEGASLSSKDLLASNIASHAFGAVGPRVKYSSGSNKLTKAVASLATQPFLVNSFNANYTDNGLFGFHIIANKSDAAKIVKGVIKASKSGLSNQEIETAKNSLKASLAYSHENSDNLISSLGLNPENPNTSDLNQILKAVDSVSANDVNAFVKKATTGKQSLAAVGDLSELPNLDELAA